MIMEKTVDEQKNNNDDQFPVGMRVLAVDDDPTCLMLLENLLRKCQYHVTTTSQAITALKMLRENKNKFDLVISDVHMPDMDGFKLLELVGLEMDLPVIMLSAYGDNKLVMKGITHGACDYLLKPVRIEELKNIWQHVIRRKKFDPKDKKDFGKPQGESGEGEGSMGTGDYDPNTKLNRKRKDQNDDEDEDRDENGNEDPSTQKKPRVVWSVDLHRKFVAAVNHLGIDKAVPKRILDLMNVEKLSRENVASHLQKYRLYLKRISSVASQQANMMAALGSADSAYMRMASFNGGFGNLQTMAGSGQFQNAAYGSLSPSSVLNRLNTPSGIAMNTLSSSRRVQLGQPQNSSNPILQGMPMSAEFDQMQHNLSVTQIGDLPATTNDTMGSIVYPVSSCFSGTKINGGSSSNSILGGLNNPISLQNGQRRVISQNQPSVTVNANPDFSSHLPDFERCNDNWPSALQPSEIQSHSYTLIDSLKQTTPSDLRNDMSSMPITSVPTQFQAASISSVAGQNMNLASKQGWEDHNKRDAPYDPHHSNILCSSMNSSIPHCGGVGPFNQNLNPRNAVYDKNNDLNLVGQSNFLDPLSTQHNDAEQMAFETTTELKHGYIREDKKLGSSYTRKNVDSLEDLVTVMMTKQEQNVLTSKEGNVGCDNYSHSLGTCI
ncbi:hypothetical protein LguiB_027495 [Lonicera macranthoides]